MKQQTTKIPKLAPPGAGIPWFMKLVLRLVILPAATKKMSKETSFKLFLKEGARILELVRGKPPELLETKVLVPKQRGLEDSSRFWSAHMAIEHLMIVGNGIAGAVIELSRGNVPSEKVDIAKVKPLGGDSAPFVVEKFETFMKELQGKIESGVSDLDSPTTHLHPWFGPMNAQQWLWLLGVHQNIHRIQIQEILKRV